MVSRPFLVRLACTFSGNLNIQVAVYSLPSQRNLIIIQFHLIRVKHGGMEHDPLFAEKSQIIKV